MIDLPAKAEVLCSDGVVGLSTYVIVKPGGHQMTHLVVKSIKPPFREYLVPAKKIQETTPNQIKLECTRNELEKMESFVYEEYIREEFTTYVVMPTFLPGQIFPEQKVAYVPVKHHNVPWGESAICCNAKVEATDGYIGKVDELLINSGNMQPTHLILREGHIFKHLEIIIPVSQIERVDGDTVYLKLNQQRIEELPAAPVQRWQLQES